MFRVDAQPLLADDLVRLRPLVEADWEGIHAVGGDPALWAVHPSPDRWQEPVLRRYFDAGVASGSALAIEEAGSGRLIGTSRYTLDRASAGEVEIGSTFIARDHWGGATNRAVKRLMIGHALTGYDRTIFLVGEENGRSRRAMEKIGGVLTDRRIDALTGDRRVRHVVYAIDRSGFASGPLMHGD